MFYIKYRPLKTDQIHNSENSHSAILKWVKPFELNDSLKVKQTFGNSFLKGSYFLQCLNNWKNNVLGKVDSAGKFTGQDIAFVYPDMLTCLVGTFKATVA